MKKDPIFDIETPLLFAHRGGAGEVPESTKEAFSHAIQVGSDILELDVQLTKDSRLVVWHGPKLDNVLIDNVSSSKWLRWFKRKRSIWQFSWDELRDKAWVVEPRFKKLKHMEDPEAGKKEQRQLMLLRALFEELWKSQRQGLSDQLLFRLPAARKGTPSAESACARFSVEIQQGGSPD